MNFSTEIGEVVADILADFCELTGAVIDEDRCEAENKFEGSELTKNASIAFTNVNVDCKIYIENSDISGEIMRFGLYDNDDKDVFFEVENGAYDKSKLLEAFKKRKNENIVVFAAELKDKIAGFISDSEYDIQGPISYKL